MKFKVLTEFKHGFNTFEEGNNHSSEKLGFTDERTGTISVADR